MSKHVEMVFSRAIDGLTFNFTSTPGMAIPFVWPGSVSITGTGTGYHALDGAISCTRTYAPISHPLSISHVGFEFDVTSVDANGGVTQGNVPGRFYPINWQDVPWTEGDVWTMQSSGGGAFEHGVNLQLTAPVSRKSINAAIAGMSWWASSVFSNSPTYNPWAGKIVMSDLQTTIELQTFPSTSPIGVPRPLPDPALPCFTVVTASGYYLDSVRLVDDDTGNPTTFVASMQRWDEEGIHGMLLSNVNEWIVYVNTIVPYLSPGDTVPVTAMSDVTPAYIIYRILTSEVYGFATQSLFGFTTSADRIDQDSYAAAQQYCIDQGILLSVTYTDASDFLGIINDLLALYGGFLTDNDGLIQFGIVTADDAPIRTIDNSHLVPSDIGKPPVQVTKAALEDGYNKVQFNYFDRTLDYKQNQVEASDEVDMDINGPRIKTFQAQYTIAGSTAQMICTRALWQNLYGNDQYAFKLGWKDADLKPGSLITLVDSFDETLKGGVLARILKWQENDRGKFDVTAVQQRPYIIAASGHYTNTSSINGGFGGLIDAPAAPLHQTAYELPFEFQTSKALIFFGYAPGNMNMGAQLYLSTDGENYILTQDAQPFIISGALAQPLEARAYNYVETNVEFYLFPTSGMLVSSPTFVMTYELDDISPALRAQGAGTFIVGSEAVAAEGLTVLGQNHYKAQRLFRGWGGTPISHHNSGEWFHQQAAGIFNHEIGIDDIGNKFSYKIVPYNFVGKTYDISSIDAQSYQVLGDYWRPRTMSRVSLFVDTPTNTDVNTPVRGFVNVNGGISGVTLTWPDISNHDGFGAGGFGAGGFGHFSPDDLEPQYNILVNGTASFVVSTGFFHYTVEQNSTDFTGFQHSLVFNVQPFNAKGVGPTSSTRSLTMF